MVTSYLDPSNAWSLEAVYQDIVQNVFLEDDLLSAGTGLSKHGCTALVSKCVTGLKPFLKIRMGFLQQFNLCFAAKLKFSEVEMKGLYVIL